MTTAILAVWLATQRAAAPATVPSLCQVTEVVFFSCVATRRNRTISLCGSKKLDSHHGYLQYRFGRKGHIELQYPERREGTTQQFRYYHYGRPRVDRYGVIFHAGGFEYTLYCHYEGDEEPEQPLFGLTVDGQANGSHQDLACRPPAIGALGKLENIVPCDRGNALAQGCPE